MNDLLLQLLKIRDQIDHGGWIIIPPSADKHKLDIRVEWYINREKYAFQHIFSDVGLNQCRIGLIDEFVGMANRTIKLRIDEIRKSNSDN